MWLAYTQPTLFAYALKMNGLAFENVNYREIQLTPGQEKTLQYLHVGGRATMWLCRYARTQKRRAGVNLPTGRGTNVHVGIEAQSNIDLSVAASMCLIKQ